ncbi:MAG: 2,3-bisphosphoglycerate-independent phosphoglycerate mutase [Thermoleophilia bacterium]|jgi:2,3-bisphosphoglycerate-independent phosphoglycerate mutase|nr:2,3-bisphosphoglycerate-independent phosphoglycerate mutase [Thermoleophilia bacterium]
MRRRLLLVPDGMADEPQEALGGRTPLEAADTPAMDALARGGTAGLVQTVPPGMPAGSDVANLSALGYDPRAVYTGRSPLEAASIGVELGPGDVAYRCNLVTVVDGVMKDHTAGQVSSAEGRRLVAALQAALGGGAFEFHPGVSYRNLMVWRGGAVVPCTPPHDILDRPVAGYLPGAVGEAAAEGGAAGASEGGAAGAAEGPAAGTAAAELRELLAAARGVLAPLRPGTEMWLWGEGTAPRLPAFRELHGLSGAVVGAVDLVRGIGRCAGLTVLDVPGATGDLDTDYGAKARAALEALEDHEFVWVHVEAPDEASHQGDLAEKIRAIERVDHEVLAPLLAAADPPAVMVLPDHHTPLRLRTHAADPVPFVIGVPPRCAPAGGATAAGAGADAGGAAVSGAGPDAAARGPGRAGAGGLAFGESEAAGTGLTVATGPDLMRLFLTATG